jgi:hypothetical protein
VITFNSERRDVNRPRRAVNQSNRSAFIFAPHNTSIPPRH